MNSRDMELFKQTWVKILIFVIILVLSVSSRAIFLLRTQKNQPIYFSPPTPSSQVPTAINPLQPVLQTNAPPEWNTYFYMCKNAKFYSNLRKIIKETDLGRAIKELKEPEFVCGLDLEGSNLGNIPPEVRNLRSLKVLLLGSNRLTHVPSEIMTLKILPTLL